MEAVLLAAGAHLPWGAHDAIGNAREDGSVLWCEIVGAAGSSLRIPPLIGHPYS